MKNIATVYKKELIDTLRDRRTLIFMLLFPVFLAPVLNYAIIKFTKKIAEKKAVESVTIAADAATQERYRKLVHDWFLGTEIASGVRLANSSVMKLLLKKNDSNDLLANVPEDILTDAAAFDAWTRKLADQARTAIADNDGLRQNFNKMKGTDVSVDGASFKLPDNFTRTAMDFYFVAFRGLGLVNFADPAKLEAPPANVVVEIPAALKGRPDAANIAWAIKSKKLHGYLEIPAEVEKVLAEPDRKVVANFYYDSTISLSDEAHSRVERTFNTAGGVIVGKRLAAKGLSRNFNAPLALAEDQDISTKSSRAFNFIGGFISYLLILYVFLGGIYPSIDLGAGEKERNTLETLLLSPATRSELAVGKFLVILTTSVTAALLGIASMGISVMYMIPQSAMEQLEFKIAPSTIASVALLAFPLAMSFSGMLLAVSIFARSFKEAQNYMAPLQFLILPAAIAPLIPGFELNWKLALIPMLNVCMIIRDFFKGDINWAYYGLTMLSSVAFAGACVAACVAMFRREEVLFRS